MNRERVIWTVIFVVAGVYLAYRALTFGIGSEYVQDVDGQAVAASAWDAAAGTAHRSWPRTIGVWVAAFFTLSIMSFLYRDNPFYKTAESIVVGVTAAFWMVGGLWTTLVPNLFGKLAPGWINSWAMPGLSPVRESFWYVYFVPLMLGVLLLWRLAPRGGWIARWPLAFVIGTFAGLRLLGYMQGDFLRQINDTIKPLVVVKDGTAATSFAARLGDIDIGASVANTIIVFGVLAGLVYFFFSVEHKGVIGRISKVGIWILMITFGAAFGYTVMGRVALLAIRLEFLFDDWLWLIDPTGIRPPMW